VLFRILLEGFCGCFCLIAGFSGPDGVTPPPLCVPSGDVLMCGPWLCSALG